MLLSSSRPSAAPVGPVTGNAKSSAQRQAEFRARRAKEGLVRQTVYTKPGQGADAAVLAARVAELETENKRLCGELARLERVYNETLGDALQLRLLIDESLR